MSNKIKKACLAFALTAVVGASFTATACSESKHPEVTISISFNGSNFDIDYTLSRNMYPQTVQHFIELADAGYYDGMCIHDYTSNALYSGGYKLVDGELEEVDYFNVVKELESEKEITFTQSVWKDKDQSIPLYTVYGEFTGNGVQNERSREYRHSEGALVMYYTPKVANGKGEIDVTVERADGGKNNDGNVVQTVHYSTNSATSLFYTYTGTSGAALDENYCVFGKAKEDDY